jgi:hypothetical protein
MSAKPIAGLPHKIHVSIDMRVFSDSNPSDALSMPDDPRDCHRIFDATVINAIDDFCQPMLLCKGQVCSSQFNAGLTKGVLQ